MDIGALYIKKIIGYKVGLRQFKKETIGWMRVGIQRNQMRLTGKRLGLRFLESGDNWGYA